MKLNNKGWGLQELLILSAILFVFLLVVAYYIFVLYNQLDTRSASVYLELEKTLKTQAMSYAKKFNEKEVITLSDLKRTGYIDIFSDNKDNRCDGYVLVNEEYKAYISCEYYETKGYDKDYE